MVDTDAVGARKLMLCAKALVAVVAAVVAVAVVGAVVVVVDPAAAATPIVCTRLPLAVRAECRGAGSGGDTGGVATVTGDLRNGV
jgi:hypothetical protein